MTKFASAMCRRESCACGAPAAHRVVEVIFPDDPNPRRAPLSTFLCRRHFGELMGPAACEILADRRLPSDHDRPTLARPEKPQEPPKSVPQKKGQAAASEQAERLPLLVGILQASELLGLSRSTLYKLISAGTIRTTKIGKRTLIETAALRALASNGA